MKTQLFLIIVALNICVSQLIAGEPTAKIVAFGIFKTVKKELINTPSTPSGTSVIVDDTPLLVTATNRIPARRGVCFGIDYQISGIDLKDGDLVEVENVTRCPPFKKADGSICESSTLVMKLRVQDGKARGFSGYIFDIDEVMVPGTWTMGVKLNGKTLARQEFSVYRE